MGSRGPSRAAREQQAQADQRDRDIQDASAQINAIFDNPARAQEVRDYQNAVRQRQMGDLNQQFGDQARNLKFAMARSGLTSGSADVDLHDRLNQDYAKGALQVTAAAKQAGANLRSADEATRSRLLGQAATGYGLTDVNQQALSGAESNLQTARGSIAPATFGALFDAYPQIYAQSQLNASRRAAEQAGLGTLFNTAAPGSTGANSGLYY
jgi:hypothetical protein